MRTGSDVRTARQGSSAALQDDKEWRRNAPSGWQANNYWSATPSASGHASVHLYLGYVYDYPVTHYAAYSVALQVL